MGLLHAVGTDADSVFGAASVSVGW